MDALGDTVVGHSGNTCVASTAYVGQMIIMPNGQSGTLTKLEGESRRCTQPGLPIRAVVDFEAPQIASQPAPCVRDMLGGTNCVKP